MGVQVTPIFNASGFGFVIGEDFHKATKYEDIDLTKNDILKIINQNDMGKA